MGAGSRSPSVFAHHLSREERRARGKSLRDGCPRSSHAGWKAPAGRPDPVQLVLQADKGRIPELLPLRHGRMALSPFTFYRGAALNMAVDLARTPASGLRAQCCGDAHLVNFRGFATPERRSIFAINDLDETLPGPWEWDLKRLTTSFVVACRDNGLPDSFARDAVLICSRSYRERMAEFAEMKVLDLWYRAIDSDELIGGIKDIALRQRAIVRLEKERARTVAEDFFPRVSGPSGKAPAFEDQRPTLFHARGHRPGKVHPEVLEGFALALSHARSGDPAAMSGYLGKSDAMDQALAAFSMAYADQNEKDHAALRRAIRAGKVKAVRETAA